METYLKAFKKAINRLQEAIDLCAPHMVIQDNPLSRVITSGTIQTFEFTYEVAIKLIHKYLVDYEVKINEDVRHFNFVAMIKMGHQRGILRSDYKTWVGFREARNRTSHVYNDQEVLRILVLLPDFLEEMGFMYKQIASRITYE